MIRPHRSGIALILVISLIGLMSITLGYLSHSCRIMMLQTDRRYLKAVERNLTASGLAWAGGKGAGVGVQGSGEKGQSADLDVNAIGGVMARLSVRIEDVNGPPGPGAHPNTRLLSPARGQPLKDLSASKALIRTRKGIKYTFAAQIWVRLGRDD